MDWLDCTTDWSASSSDWSDYSLVMLASTTVMSDCSSATSDCNSAMSGYMTDWLANSAAKSENTLHDRMCMLRIVHTYTD